MTPDAGAGRLVPPGAGVLRKRLLRISGSLRAESLKAQLARGAAKAFVINLASVGLGFLSQLVLARVLGVEGYGIYAYVFAWVTVLGLLARSGFPTSLLRFVSAYRVQQEWGLLRGVIRYAEVRVAVASVLVALVGSAVVWALAERLGLALANAFLVGLWAVPLVAMVEVRCAIARALGQVTMALVPERLVPQAILVVCIGFIFFLPAADVGPVLALGFRVTGLAVALALVSWVAWNARRAVVAPNQPLTTGEQAAWRSAALALLALAVLQAVRRHADVLLVGFLLDTTDAGIYRVASYVAGLVAFPLGAINIVFAPVISAYHAQGDRESLQAMVTATARWIFATALIIALPLLIAPEFILGLFGSDFVAGATALRILLIGQLINALTGSVGFLMTMTGHERPATVIFGVAAALAVVLTVALVPVFGISGAAAATASGLVVWNLALAVFIYRRLGVVPSIVRI